MNGTCLASRYEVVRELGRGGMGVVYLARDPLLERDVAVKVIPPAVLDAQSNERFRREARTIAQLDHPGIVGIHDFGAHEESLFLVMPYVRGETLRRRLERDGTLPLDESVHLAGEVADALMYAHAQSVIHRDIRPENIMLESGHALLLDFGIARALEASAGEQVSTTGVVVGHPAYMSPEQARVASDLDGRTDIYSLGCVLYEMLAGLPPFTGATRAAVLARQVGEPVPPLRGIRPTLPQRIEHAVMKALAKRPADRFRTAGELVAALRE
jgi:serine/threonine-protein kinase